MAARLTIHATPTPLFPGVDREVAIRPADRAIPSRTQRWILLLRCSASLLWRRLRGPLPGDEIGRRVREVFEGLGGLWIKVGQLLSLRVDLFGRAFCSELARLQDRVFGFPSEDAIAIIERELALPLDTLFSEFDRHPVAAASIGQVHRARLREGGIEVAVKVQRPGMAETFERQLRAIRRIATVGRRSGLAPYLQWDSFAWELEQIVREEVDYRYEATNTRRMRRTLAPHGIHAPRVYDRYSTRRVLTTAFIHGALMADFIALAMASPARAAAWCEENGIDAPRLARILNHSLLRQIFEDNLFHGDLHPGNILLLRDNQVALLDFGTVSSTEREYLEQFRLASRAFATRNYATAADMTVRMCGIPPAIDLEPLRRDLLRSVHEWARRTDVTTMAYHQKSLNAFYAEMTRVLARYQCPAEWTFLRIQRAQETLDASLLVLNPGADPAKLMLTYFQRATRRATRTDPRANIARALRLLATADETLHRLSEMATLQLNVVMRQAQVFGARATRVARIGAWLATVVASTALILAIAVATIGVPGKTLAPGTNPGPLGTNLAPNAEVGTNAVPTGTIPVPPQDWDPQVRALAIAATSAVAISAWRARRRLLTVRGVIQPIAAVRI